MASDAPPSLQTEKAAATEKASAEKAPGSALTPEFHAQKRRTMAVASLLLLFSTSAIDIGKGFPGYLPNIADHVPFIIFGLALWTAIDCTYLAIEWWVESRPLLRLPRGRG